MPSCGMQPGRPPLTRMPSSGYANSVRAWDGSDRRSGARSDRTAEDARSSQVGAACGLSRNRPIQRAASRDRGSHSCTESSHRGENLCAVFQRRSAIGRLEALVNQLDPALIHVNDIWWVPHTVRAIARRTVQSRADRGPCETGNRTAQGATL